MKENFLRKHPARIVRIAAAILMASGASLFGQAPAKELPAPMATVSQFKKAPTLDGKVEPGEWDGAVKTTNFQDCWRPMMDLRSGYSLCGFTEDKLYVAVVSEYEPTGPWARAKNRDVEDVVFDSSVEIWIDPNRANRATDSGDLGYYQCIINSAGSILDVRFDPKSTPSRGWNGNWEWAAGTDKQAGLMTIEVAIPFSDFGWKPGTAAGKAVGMLVARNFKCDWCQATAFPFGGSFDKVSNYAEIRLTKDEPSVRVEKLGDEFFQGQVDLAMSIYNPGPARKARINVTVTSSDMPEKFDEKTIDLPAGGSAEYRYELKGHLHADAEHCMAIRVASDDGSTPYFGYYCRWTAKPNLNGRKQEQKWTIRDEPNPGASVALKFYPSFKLLSVKLEPAFLFKTPEESTGVKSAEITVAGPDGKAVVEEAVKWEAAPFEKEFKLPDLPDGEYKVAVSFDGYKDPIQKTFQQKHYPWQGNSLGITDKIYPPFLPLEVKDKTVKVVLREYSVGGLGLWDSVKANGEELLAAPISLINDGKPVQGKGEFTDIKPQAVVYGGKAESAGATIVTRCTTEFDGCMKVEMVLTPSDDGKELSSLCLEIPFKEEMAPLFHVSGASLRSNPAGSIPAGEGDVWDSRMFPDGNWNGNFKPYVWAGKEGPGICWFADNDKNWELKLLDEKKKEYAPSIVINRAKGTVKIVVNLIQKPVKITAPRKIVFGLMATPAKPLPSDWRRYTMRDHFEGVKPIELMGSEYWGAETDCASKYPINKDLSILDAMRDARLGKPVPQDFVQQWAARNFPEGWKPKAGKDQKHMADLANVSVNWSRNIGAKSLMSVYFDEFHSTTPAHEEVAVFGDEWSGEYNRKGSVGGLVRSHQDFACFWAAEFIRRGIGIYLDNSFPKRFYDPMQSDAYRLPDGSIQPSAGIWAHREYLRRLWNLHRELSPKEAPAIMFLHMTNADVVPYTVWNEVNLDLEWFYGVEPKQKVYAPDLLRAESIGLQSGNIPTALARIDEGGLPKEKLDFLNRTRFGVLMVHEIRPDFSLSGLEILKKMMAFGYGLPGCAVSNYWLKTHPVAPNNPQIKTLFMKKGAEALILLCTWNQNPETANLALDAKSLGFEPKQALDEENGKPLEMKGGALSIPLIGYDVRLIRVK